MQDQAHTRLRVTHGSFALHIETWNSRPAQQAVAHARVRRTLAIRVRLRRRQRLCCTTLYGVRARTEMSNRDMKEAAGSG